MKHLFFLTVMLVVCPSLWARQLQLFNTGFGDQSAEVTEMAVFYAAELRIAPGLPTTIGIMRSHDLPASISGYMEHRENETLGVQNVMIKINSSVDPADLPTVIAHEMVHASQYVRGDLYKLNDLLFRWRGQLVFDIRSIPYRQRKWEAEAFAMERKLVKEYRKWKMHPVDTATGH